MSKMYKLISDNFPKLEWELCGDLHLLSCHVDHLQPDEKIKFHEHPYWELTFMLSGSLITYCDELKIPCRENEYELFLAPPGTIHRRNFSSSDNNSNLTYVFTIYDINVSEPLTELCINKGFHFTVSGFSAEIIKEIRRNFQAQTASSRQIMTWLAGTFLWEFLKEYAEFQETEVTEQLFWDKLNPLERAEEIQIFLLSHISNPDINKQLSNHFKLSLRQLNRIYKQKWNCSISAAITSFRQEQSRILLRNTETTIQEISRRMGFVSRAGFYAFFKKYNGMTPTEFKSKQGIAEELE